MSSLVQETANPEQMINIIHIDQKGNVRISKINRGENMTKSNQKYKYRIIEMNGGSSKFGNCDVCKKPAGKIYHQIEMREYIHPTNEKINYTRDGCHDLFGHKSCLIKKRK
jgi:hypothetical protein